MARYDERDTTIDELRERQKFDQSPYARSYGEGPGALMPINSVPASTVGGGKIPDPNAPLAQADPANTVEYLKRGGVAGPATGGAGLPENFGNAPPGFDAGKWGDKSHTSPKYTVGRALAMNPNNPEGALALIRQSYPDATLDGDRLDIPSLGIRDVDVLFGLKGGAWQPQWLQNGAGGGQGGGQDFGPMNSGSLGLTNNINDIINSLLGSGGAMNNDFIRELMSGKLGGRQ